MAKTAYDPKAKYVVLHGTLSMKGSGNNRRYVKHTDVDDKGQKVQVDLSHLQPHQIAYLADNLRQVQLASEYAAANTPKKVGNA